MPVTLAIILVLILGFFLGRIFKDYSILKWSDKTVNILLYCLLFIFGLSLGQRKDLLENIGQIGVEISILTLAAMLGSVIVAKIVYQIFYLRQTNEK